MFKNLLKGKKTYIVVVGLMLLNFISDPASLTGLDLAAIKEQLLLALVATARAAVQQIEDLLGSSVN